MPHLLRLKQFFKLINLFMLPLINSYLIIFYIKEKVLSIKNSH